MPSPMWDAPYISYKGVVDNPLISDLAKNQGYMHKRRSIFLTTKIWAKDFGYENVYRKVLQGIKELNTPYLDLVLLHVAGEKVGKEGPSCLVQVHI